MKRNPEIQQELIALSKVLNGLDTRLPYLVPDGYFNSFPEKMLEIARESGSQNEIIPQIPGFINLKSTALTVPEGYFNELPDLIMKRIRLLEGVNEIESELAEYDPVLVKLRKINPFYLEDGYFKQLKVDIPNAQETRVIPMNSRKKWVRYAAAAVIIGVMALSGYLYNEHKNIENIPVLSEGKDQLPFRDADSLQISDDDLAFFLEDNNGISAPELLISSPDQPLVLLEINDQSLGEMLKEVSDLGIKEYISENPEALSNENTNQYN